MSWHTLSGFLADENGTPSSRRLLGFLGGLSLIAYMFVYPSESANNSVLIFTSSCLGLAAIGKLSDLIKPNAQ